MHKPREPRVKRPQNTRKTHTIARSAPACRHARPEPTGKLIAEGSLAYSVASLHLAELWLDWLADANDPERAPRPNVARSRQGNPARSVQLAHKACDRGDFGSRVDCTGCLLSYVGETEMDASLLDAFGLLDTPRARADRRELLQRVGGGRQ